VAEALGLTLVHAALAPSGQPIWLELGRRSAAALVKLEAAGLSTHDILTDAALANAMAVFAAFGGSTNLLLHLPAIAHAAGLSRPSVADWTRVNRAVPRLVDVLPNGPVGHPTVRVFLAGGVPEVMLHLRELGLLRQEALTAHGRPLGDRLDAWARSERRQRLRQRLYSETGIDPDAVILPPGRARQQGLASSLTFPTGNLAPEGSVVKSAAIDSSVIDPDGVYRKTGSARVFTSERAAIAAVKGQGERPLRPGDILILVGRGPLGCGMEETFQVTAALRYLSWGKHVALITDARFSGVSTGACIGHVGPEALAGGPLGRVRDGDTIRIVIDTVNLVGSVDLVGDGDRRYEPAEGARVLAARPSHPDLAPDPDLPEDTRLWAALQAASGGVWGGCVYDVERIVAAVRGPAAGGQRPER
jgi:putative YjhG/YagF family dehydratase